MSTFRILENFLFNDAVTLTASSADSEFPVSNLTNHLRSKVWRTTGVTSETLVIDLQTTEDIDSFAVVFSPEKTIYLTTAAVVTLQANHSNTWGSPAVSQVVSLDEENASITHFFSTSQSYRYWRIKIEDPTNPYGFIEIPKVILSDSIQPEHGPEIGFTHTITDLSKAQATDFGQVYHDIYPFIRSFNFKLPLLTITDIETLADFYSRVGTTQAVGISLDPLEVTFDKDRFFTYGLIDDFKINHRHYTYFDYELKIRELL